MKQLFFIVTAITLTLSSYSQKLYKLPNGSTPNDYIANTIIIKVKPQFKNDCERFKINNTSFNLLAASIGVQNLQKKFPNNNAPDKPTNNNGFKLANLSQIYELTYTATVDIEKAISKLLASGILEYAEPHFLPTLFYSPNDPQATPLGQYHLQNIQAYAGWDVDKGDSSIVIGITDTGIEPFHEDLNTNIKRNFADVIDGTDNDNDGYIDNYMGWDLGVNDNDPTWQSLTHGIHVSGLAGMQTDNLIGGAGTGFNCKILPIKIANAAGSLIAAYEGIKYAADHGCHIINCSWGGTGASQYGQDIVDYATINKNCLVVAAAGNNGAEQEFFPAAYNYVFAVANTQSDDTRYNQSNYGSFIDVCAPGTNVVSTIQSNQYTPSTGTSMASPVTAGIAGIVKNHFPGYNGLQVGERIKVTCDNIYPLNVGLENKLGGGRINLFRALTDPATPSVVFLDKTVTDKNDESFLSGDTLFIAGKFINYLDATTALNVTVTPLSALATSIDNTTALGVITTLASKTNSLDPFSFKLNGSLPVNQALVFEVLLNDGTYTSKQFFTVFVNIDYVNITENNVFTTATSKGKIGYNQDAQAQGLGFKYNDVDILYEGGLLVGIDTNTVADCVRGANPNAADVDFMAVAKITRQTPSVLADHETAATFNTTGITATVQQNTYAWGAAPNLDYVIWEYIITNTHITDTIKNLYTGIFADWDIDGATFGQNKSAYDASTKMGYSYYTGAVKKYAGIKLLTNSAAPNFYAIDNVTGGAGGFDISNGFDTKEKYNAMRTQRLAAGVVGAGTDVANVMSTGPLEVLPNQQIKVAFAILGGDSLNGIIASATNAQTQYDGLTTSFKNNLILDDDLTLYPNPTNGLVNIIQVKNHYNVVEVFNSNGQLITKKQLLTLNQNIDLSKYTKGIYILKLIGDKKQLIKKIVLID